MEGTLLSKAWQDRPRRTCARARSTGNRNSQGYPAPRGHQCARRHAIAPTHRAGPGGIRRFKRWHEDVRHLELETTFQGCRFALGIRNAHDKSMRLAMTVGYRVLVCDNMAFSGDFTPLLAKHSKNFNLIHSLDIGVSEMQRNFRHGPSVVKVVRDARSRIELEVPDATGIVGIHDWIENEVPGLEMS
jgi:hypothetical protein